jgi:predicted  nucleic acid-binding Zn-ribbon protein
MKIEIPKTMADKFTAKLEHLEELQALEANKADCESLIKETQADLDRLNAQIEKLKNNAPEFDIEDVTLVAEAIRNRNKE